MDMLRRWSKKLAASFTTPSPADYEAHKFFSVRSRGPALDDHSSWIAFVFEADRDIRDFLSRHLFDYRVIFVRPTQAGHYARTSLRLISRATNKICIFTETDALAKAAAADPSVMKTAALATRTALDALYPREDGLGLWLHGVDGRRRVGPAGAQSLDQPLKRAEQVSMLFDAMASRRRRMRVEGVLRGLVVGDVMPNDDDAEIARAAAIAEATGARAYMPNPLATRRTPHHGVRMANLVYVSPADYVEDQATYGRLWCMDPLSADVLSRAGADARLFEDPRPAEKPRRSGPPNAPDPRAMRPAATLADPVFFEAANVRLCHPRREREASLSSALGAAMGERSETRSFLHELDRIGALPDDAIVYAELFYADPSNATAAPFAKALREALLGLTDSRGARSRLVSDMTPFFVDRFYELGDDVGAAICTAVAATSAAKGRDVVDLLLDSLDGDLEPLTPDAALEGRARVFRRDYRASVELVREFTRAGRDEAAALFAGAAEQWSEESEKLLLGLQRLAAGEDEPFDAEEEEDAAPETEDDKLRAFWSETATPAPPPPTGVAETLDTASVGVLTQIAKLQLERGHAQQAIDNLRGAALLGDKTATRRYLMTAAHYGELEDELALAEAEVRAEAARVGKSGDLRSETATLLYFRMLVFADRRADAMDILNEAVRAKRVRRRPAILSGAEYFLEAHSPERTLELAGPLDPRDGSAATLASVRAEAYGMLGRLEEAEAEVIAGLKAEPKSLRLLRLHANILERSRRHDEAVETLDALAARRPNEFFVVKRWARALRLSGQIDKRAQEISVRVALREGVFLNDAKRGPLLLSALHAENGDLAAATGWAMQAFETDPSDRYAADAAVMMLRLLADKEGARRVAENFEAAAGGGVADQMTVIKLWRAEGELERAQSINEAALAAHPQDCLLLEALARTQIEKDAPDAAVDQAEAAIRIDAGRSNAFALAGQAATMASRFDEAERYLTTLLRGDPMNARGLALRGRLREQQGRHHEALSDYLTSEETRISRAETRDLRNCWSIATTAGALRLYDRMRLGSEMLVEGLKQAMPPDLPAWRGEPLDGKRVLVVIRGGPGDEMRFYSALLSAVYEEAAHLTLIGDGRLEGVFRANFPTADFIRNPWLGRRLLKTQRPVEDQYVSAFAPGGEEVLRRFSSFIPKNARRDYDYVLYNEDVTHQFYFKYIEERHASPARKVLELPEDRRAAVRAALAGVKGPKIAISWRGAYFNPNRRVSSFLFADELEPIFRVPGVTFIDSHPNPFEGETTSLLERTGAQIVRVDQFDMMNDFAALGWIFKEVDAVITPGITQRDVAGAVRADGVWSFGVMPGLGESWRIHPESGSDAWQAAIQHHDINRLGTREAVVEGLAARVRALAEAKGARPRRDAEVISAAE